MPVELEDPRLAAEYAALLSHPVLDGSDMPCADGRPMLLVPGFLASDWTLGILFLRLRRHDLARVRRHRPEVHQVALIYSPVLLALVQTADRGGARVARAQWRVSRAWDRHAGGGRLPGGPAGLTRRQPAWSTQATTWLPEQL
jgi:hypothetical protein